MDEQNCDCCEGTEILTPVNTANRPGLSALRYRIGTHASFLETMKARLSSLNVQIPEPNDPDKSTPGYPLRALTSRNSDDASIALLDSWATVGDVLTFYQERIANEGFLRTATERRSVLELARLIGYALRPGVAASVFLALDLDKGYEIEIQPHEVKAQSVPSTPQEQPQIFENNETLEARATWNRIQPRLTRPQTFDAIMSRMSDGTAGLYLKGINTNLKANDVMLLVEGTQREILTVIEVKSEPDKDRTLVILQPRQTSETVDASAMIGTLESYIKDKPATGRRKPPTEMAQRVIRILQTLIQQLQTPDLEMESARSAIHESATRISEEFDVAQREEYRKLAPWLRDLLNAINETTQQMMESSSAARSTARQRMVVAASPNGRDHGQFNDPLARAMQSLTRAASVPPRNALNLERNLTASFSLRADIGLQLAATFDDRLNRSLPAALSNVTVTPDRQIHVYVFRSAARPFGHNAQPRPVRFDSAREITITGEWSISNPFNESVVLAAFVAEPLGGDAPLSVRFSNRSTGAAASYEWNFGDGSATSNAIHPQHEFTAPGNYTVRLTARSAAGSSTADATIIVTGIIIEGQVANPSVVAMAAVAGGPVPGYHTPEFLYLDSEYKVQSDHGWIYVNGPDVSEVPLILNLEEGDATVTQRSLAAYGVSAKTTLLKLGPDKKWLNDNSDFSAVRSTVVYVESEELQLADEPMSAPVCDGVSGLIELNELYNGMQSGRWVIVSGERSDIPDGTDTDSVRGVRASELVMLAEVIQDISSEDGKPFYYSQSNRIETRNELAGDSTHTWVRLARRLEYCYARDSVTIYGNVLKATHGETRKETLGNGDASQAFQMFTLKQSPLTFISSPTPAGAESTLSVYVNDVRWREADSLADLLDTDHKFITKTDDAGKTTVITGNGERGARLPTGQSNIRAEYRSGIGQPGNVQAEQISLLVAKPLGVQSVRNPLRASGGADRESMDTARKNAPLTVTALDRLVSVSDYADFARTFAGIGKSAVALLTDGQRQVVHVTIAGADDIPIDETSDLYGNLLRALRDFGDADVPIVLQVRELLLLVLSANLQILPDYQWEPVAKAVRAKLLDIFSFARRELGQDVFVSEVIAAVQSVRGVAYVDVDVLGGIPEKETFGMERRQLSPQEINQKVQQLIELQQSNTPTGARREPRRPIGVNLAAFDTVGMRPAQLAYFTPTVTDTIVLNQVK